MDAICDDLQAEHEALDEVVAAAAPDAWDAPTPAAGWMVRDQISHLWFFDQRAMLALVDPDAFRADAEAILASRGSDPSITPGRSMEASELLAAWRDDRRRLIEVARTVDPSARIPWYGPAMAARSFITARLMETWAHGQDVVDALGADRPATSRLRHVAHIGVRARAFSYANRGLAMPDREVHVALTGPDGDQWTWGDPAATDSVRGPAIDFCLAVTQRRHRDDTALEIEGEAAQEWMSIAQAFAGPPSDGRPAGTPPR